MPVVSELSVGDYLQRLGSRASIPGGGAVAALSAAEAAALVEMVARYSDRGSADARDLAGRVAQRAAELRVAAEGLVQADMDAFGAVSAAYGLPRDSDDEKAARRRAIAVASRDAARPAAAVIEIASETLDLAETLHPIASRSIITDIAAAASSARAAASIARLNVEVNLGGAAAATAARIEGELRQRCQLVDVISRRADAIVHAVRRTLEQFSSAS